MAKCGKLEYTLKDAKIALSKIRQRRKWKCWEKRYYYCDRCDAYHLTKEDKRK